MNVLTFTLLVGAGSILAGLLGALTGLGGGVVIVPMLALGFGIDVRYAIGASLVSVIATSSGAASAYVREGYTNIRIGMFLETATTIGSLAGAWVAMLISPSSVALVFGLVLLISAYLSSRPRTQTAVADVPDSLAVRLRLDGDFPTADGLRKYHVRRIPLGWCLMLLAGAVSGMLGIGSGAFKVLAMDQAMRIPFKVSTTTSNFMIGVTAAASAGIYLGRGYIDPGVAMPVTIGVLLGALLGSRILVRAASGQMRRLFAIVVFLLGCEMIYKSLTGGF